jgi:hypothetical protein
VPSTVTIDPMFSAAVYAPVTSPTRCAGTSRRITTGITMLPIVIADPISSVPAITTGAGPIERTTTPASTPSRQISTAASGPARRITRTASGAASAKQSTGSPVSSPETVAEIPRSAWMSPSTGAGATIGARRLSAATRIPPTTAHGRRPDRARAGNVGTGAS